MLSFISVEEKRVICQRQKLTSTTATRLVHSFVFVYDVYILRFGTQFTLFHLCQLYPNFIVPVVRRCLRELQCIHLVS